MFPHFIVAELPPGVTGLLVAAIFAAAMSTVDSSLNSSATLILCDLYQRYVRPAAGERESMRVLHATTLAWGALGTGIGLVLAVSDIQSALDAWWKLSGIFSGGMLGLFLLGLISRRAGNAAAATGVAVGVSVITWMTLSLFPTLWPESLETLRSPLHSFLITVVGTLAILLVGVLVGLVAAANRES